ncbi:MAG: hypothetical protein AAGK22_01935 [Acidobacteriota bacterium]
MTRLTLLLLIKILGTLPVAVPMLTFSHERLDRISGFGPSHEALYRVYGMALVALLVGYGGGIVQAQSGDYPLGVLIMGLVSNAGATLVLLLTGQAKRQLPAAVFFGLIAAGLAIALLAPEAAMAPAW